MTASCAGELGYLRSALAREGRFVATADIAGWIEARAHASALAVRRIPFAELEQWSFDPATGDLAHVTGGFFRIEGVRVETNFGDCPTWEQPIIVQPEIGILGILTRVFDGIPYFLMQAKTEPGNVNAVQLSPTVQATRSNYQRLHRGREPDYLRYFVDRDRSRVVVDLLQAEQGSRFLRKRNRNVILEIEDDVPLLEGYCWLTLGQIRQAAAVPNLLNMDSRSVLSNLRLLGASAGVAMAADTTAPLDPFAWDLLVSESQDGRPLHSIDEVLSWITEMKTRYRLTTEYVPLGRLDGWSRGPDAIRDRGGRFFEVLAVAVETASREVGSWTQPLLRSTAPGVTGVLARRIGGVLHFLMQARVEPGFRDTVEITPTITCGQCTDAPAASAPPLFLDLFTSPGRGAVRYATRQSLEGGRFFQDQHTYAVVELDADDDLPAPDNYRWLTLRQIKDLLRYNTVISLDTRELLACLGP